MRLLPPTRLPRKREFFSFGTNDLTQMTFGFSRDDAGKFLGAYYDKKIYESDPFARLDQNGVGKLVQMAAKLGTQTRPDIKLGICGEHGGDPSSVDVLPQGWSELCFLLSVPCADRSSGGGSCGDPREAGSAVSCKVSFTGDTANLPYPFFLVWIYVIIKIARDRDLKKMTKWIPVSA